MRRRLDPIEPAARSFSDPAAIAILFTTIGFIGMVPGLFGLCTVTALAADHSEPLAPLILLFGVMGYAQLAFYVSRSAGKAREFARAWWISTYLYNVILAAVCIAVFIQQPHPGPAVATFWFGLLAALAIMAWRGEPIHHSEASKGQWVRVPVK